MVLLTPLLRLLHGRYGQPCQVIGSDGVFGYHCRFATPDCVPREDEHWIDRWHRFAAMTPPAFALPAFRTNMHEATAPCLVLNAGDREDLAEWLARRGLARTKIILLQPGSGRPRSRGQEGSSGDPDRWPRANWVALIRALLADPGDCSILVCGSPSEMGPSRELAGSAGSPRVQAMGDDLPLRRFMALCEHAGAMIAVDSEFAQVAAAFGCPLIVLYGSRQPSLWRPRSPTGSPVQALGGRPARRRMDQVTLDEVLFSWQGLRTWTRASASPDVPQGMPQ